MKNLSTWITRPLAYRSYRYKINHVIIAINILLFIFTQLQGNLHLILAMNPRLVMSGRVWTVVTYMFDHASFSHLFFNMLGLFFFGSVVEHLWGSNEYMLLYGIIGGLAGLCAFLIYVITNQYGVFLLGASGVVYGILLIFACMFPYQRVYVFGIFPITAKVLMIIFIGIQLLSVVSQRGGQIAYFTHLSGIGVAWLYLCVRHRINPYHKLFGK